VVSPLVLASTFTSNGFSPDRQPRPMHNGPDFPHSRRSRQLAADWCVDIGDVLDTNSSEISFGHRDGKAVVLKVVKQLNDEWHAGSVLAAFDGRGTVRVVEHAPGAMLLERLEPGTSLVDVVRSDGDDAATTILAQVIAAMVPGEPPATAPTVADLGRGFARYRATGDRQIPLHLVDKAERLYLDLCASQRSTRLLHGDLQHYNVLLDQQRGWLAIDPKGVVGEVEYEIGAAMRNPIELPELFTNPRVITSRLDRFSSMLGLDRERTLAWSFSQAVLSATWSIEDGHPVAIDHVPLQLAATLESMLG
jgi:streptomycin 6-kinase